MMPVAKDMSSTDLTYKLRLYCLLHISPFISIKQGFFAFSLFLRWLRLAS